jgi:hypothetical protein
MDLEGSGIDVTEIESYQGFPEGTEENQEGWCPGRDSNSKPSETSLEPYRCVNLRRSTM